MGVGDWVVVGMDGKPFEGYAGRISAIKYTEIKVIFAMSPNGFLDNPIEGWIPMWAARPVTEEEYFSWWRQLGTE